MYKRIGGVLALGALTLASCGKPDASGVYVARSDRDVAMFQIVQTKDGMITGRIEDISIGSGGIINDQTVAVDGAASNHDLIFKPASAWFGGVSASGSFTGDTLTIAHGGTSVTAKKASLATFDQDATQIRTAAAQEQRQVALVQAKQASEAAQAAAVKTAGDHIANLQRAASELRATTKEINDGVAAAPDYGQQSAENTAKVEQMLERANTLSSLSRYQLSVKANDVAVATYQLEVARYKYAVGLDQIVQQTAVQRFCDGPQGAQFASQCADAKAAASNFQGAVNHGAGVFKGYKQAVQQNEDRQNDMARKIGG